MGLDGHDRAVSLAAASEENDMPGRFQIGPHCGWLSAEFSHAYIFCYDQKIQFPGLMNNFTHVNFHLSAVCIHPWR